MGPAELPVRIEVRRTRTGKDADVECPLPPLQPIDPRLVALFLTDEVRRQKVSTISRRLGAIRWFHHEAGFDSPTGAKLVEDLMKGLRRSRKERPTKKAAGNSTALLRKMIQATPDDLRGIRDRAIL